MTKQKEINSVILAAGLGTRMKSELPKVLHTVCGKPILSYPVELVESLRLKKNIVVIGHKSEQVEVIFKKNKIIFAHQEKQLGSGDALKVGLKKVNKSFKGTILVLTGDTVLIKKETIEKLIDTHFKEKNSVTILSAILYDPFSYGRIKRDDKGNIDSIIEEKDAVQAEKKIKEVNSGIYCFNYKELVKHLRFIKPNNIKKEYYLTDIIAILKNRKFKIGAYTLQYGKEILGINNRFDLSVAQAIINKKNVKNLMLEGVTVLDPSSTYIDSTVSIGKDCKILPGTIIEGNVKIGKKCVIGPNTYITNSTIGNETQVRSSYIYDSKIGNNAAIGPFTHLRPNSVVKDSARVGNFSEVKNSVIGEGSKVPHLSYIGDTEMGKRVNVGAGTITCNYDGKHKYKTKIGQGSFIGSNVNLVAPVKLGKNSVVGAGSTINNNVPDSSLAIERSKQVHKLNWRKKKK